jgi:hypothetical protein
LDHFNSYLIVVPFIRSVIVSNSPEPPLTLQPHGLGYFILLVSSRRPSPHSFSYKPALPGAAETPPPQSQSPAIPQVSSRSSGGLEVVPEVCERAVGIRNLYLAPVRLRKLIHRTTDGPWIAASIRLYRVVAGTPARCHAGEKSACSVVVRTWQRRMALSDCYLWLESFCR